MRVAMRKSGAGLLAAGLFGAGLMAAALPARAEYDAVQRQQRIEQLEADEAHGGPRIVGGRSPFQVRVKVCKVLPTPVRDKKTGELVTVQKEVCWWE